MMSTYEDLLRETLPARITTEKQYDSIHGRFGELLSQRRRTQAEGKLMDLLGLLIQDYDQRHALPPDTSTPAERLRFLVDHSNKSATELLTPVFGQRSHVNEALDGKRAISAAHARKLGKLFHVDAGLFL